MRSIRRFSFCLLFLFSKRKSKLHGQQPDVSELHVIAVMLEADGCGIYRRGQEPVFFLPCRPLRKQLFIMDDHAVMHDRHKRIGLYGPVGVETRGSI